MTMAGYNRIIIVGNLTRDPELKQLPSGQSVCRLNIASNRQTKNRQTGAVVQEVCFVDVDVWGAQAESCHNFLRKGRPALVEGRLKLDSWKEADGSMRSKHSIVADRVVFLGSGQAGEQGMGDMDEQGFEPAAAPRRSAPQAAPSMPQNNMAGGSPLFKDEAPFEDDLPF